MVVFICNQVIAEYIPEWSNSISPVTTIALYYCYFYKRAGKLLTVAAITLIHSVLILTYLMSNYVFSYLPIIFAFLFYPVVLTILYLILKKWRYQIHQFLTNENRRIADWLVVYLYACALIVNIMRVPEIKLPAEIFWILIMGIAAMMQPEETQLEIGTTAQNADEVLNYLHDHPLDGGIYFLDIELGDNHDLNGVDLAEKIKQLDQRAQIVFVTAYNEYMELTYRRRIGSIDYINKNNPDLQQRLNETLRDAISNLSKANFSKKMTFSYRLGRIIRNVNIDDIYYVSTTKAPHKLCLVRNDGSAEFAGDIKNVDEQNEFLKKFSQSYLVNPKNIAQINLKRKEIIFPNRDAIKFSRRFTHVMKNMISAYNFETK